LAASAGLGIRPFTQNQLSEPQGESLFPDALRSGNKEDLRKPPRRKGPGNPGPDLLVPRKG